MVVVMVVVVVVVVLLTVMVAVVVVVSDLGLETVQGGMCARGCVRGALVAWPTVVWCELAVGGVVWSGVV